MTTIKSVFENSPQTLLVETGTHEGETYLRVNNGSQPYGDAMVATADLLAALDATANADAEAKLLEQYRRADKAEAKLAEAERTLTELAPARDERVIAWGAIAKHEAFRSCYDEDRPLLNTVVDRIGALLAAEAERDALAATVERVRHLRSVSGDTVGVEELDAALDPTPAFVLPTEAGVRFEAQYGNNDTTDVLQAVSYCDAESGAMTLYLREANLVAYTAGEVVAKFKNHRLLGADE